MMQSVLYSKLSGEDLNKSPLTDAEIALMKKASRWVIFLAFFQLTMAIFSSSPIQWILAAIFVPLGVVGATRRRPKMLIAHFVYSIFLYLVSLMAVVFLILYCESCDWPVYAFTFLIVLVQAVGMRHSRILISLVKLEQQSALPINAIVTPVPQQFVQQPSFVEQPQQQQQSEETQPQPMFYAIPVPFNGQVPQGYYPMPMPMAYPLLHPQQQPAVADAAYPPFPYKQ